MRTSVAKDLLNSSRYFEMLGESLIKNLQKDAYPLNIERDLNIRG